VRPAELKSSLGGAAPPLIGSRPEFGQDAEPTSSERAAAEVTARLKAILPDEAASADPEPFPSQNAPEPVATRPFATEPRPTESRRADATEAARASVRSIFDQTRDEPERTGIAPLAGLGLIGFSLFAGGLFWAFVSKPSGGLLSSPIIGFVLGFLGIVCVGSAVYFLLDRLGGQDRL
jgi:hypothetical protein